MRTRILRAMLGVTALTILVFGVPLGWAATQLVDQSATLSLEREAIRATRDVPVDFGTGNDPVELVQPAGSTTLGLYDARGRKVAGLGPDSADAATRRALTDHIADGESGSMSVVSVPVTADERVVGAVRAARPASAGEHRDWGVVALLLALAVASFLVGSVAAILLARRLARPIAQLGDAASALGEGNFAPPAPDPGIPEVDLVARELLRTAEQLDEAIQRERSFSADASHQLRTPLAGIKAGLETELAFPRDDPTEALREVLVDVERLEASITELLMAARTANPAGGVSRLSDVFDEVRELWHPRLSAEGRRLRVNTPGEVTVRGLPTLVRTVLEVLVDNAFIHGDGTVSIDFTVTQRTATVSVADEGKGFEISSEEPDPGHGRGLELADRMARSVGGRVVVANAGRGPRVEVVLLRAGFESDGTATP